MAKKRISLLDQVVSQLLEELGQGIYQKRLPGERLLAERLGVSRPMVRSALEVLEKQGWIAAPDRSKARIVLKRPSAPLDKQGVKRIGILIPRPITELGSDDVILVTSLVRHCEENGWLYFLFPIDQLGPSHLERRLDEILEASPCDIWLSIPLLNSRAFAMLNEKGHDLIAISCSTLTGKFGAIHYDLNAATAHAFGVMLRAGRRQIIRPVVFRKREMVERTSKILSEFGVTYKEDFHLPVFDGSRDDLIRLLDLYYAATSKPDGVIIQYTPEVSALLVEGWFMNRGLRFPEDASLIQIGSDHFMRMMFHSVTHYTTDPEPLLDATFEALKRFFTTGECLSGNLPLETTYVKGETV